MLTKSLSVLTLAVFASLASASVIWDESVQGDLSGDHLAPANFTLSNGSNELIGTTGDSDRDYFHFHLEEGQSLTNIFVRDYVSADDFAFIGVQEGSVLTEDPSNPDVSQLLGWCLWGTPQIGTDLLPKMGLGNGAIGFVPPLTGRDYTFWLQQTGDATSYRLDFEVVPEPSTFIATTGFLGLLLARRKRKR